MIVPQLVRISRAVIALDILPLLEKEAEQRMSQGGKGVEIIPPLQSGKSRDKASELFIVNPHYISDAKKIKQVVRIGLGVFQY